MNQKIFVTLFQELPYKEILTFVFEQQSNFIKSLQNWLSPQNNAQFYSNFASPFIIIKETHLVQVFENLHKFETPLLSNVPLVLK